MREATNTLKFRQDLLQSSEKGGWKAADELVHAVQSSLSDEDLGLDAENIMAWAFADFEKVTIHLLHHLNIAEDMQLYQFARGFNARGPLFHFDDVGFGKERADHKLKGMLRYRSTRWQESAMLKRRNRENAVLHADAAMQARFPRLWP